MLTALEIKTKINGNKTNGVWYLANNLTVICSYDNYDRLTYVNLFQLFENGTSIKVDGVVYKQDYSRVG